MITRTEFPRPDFKRTDWQCLNGPWEFSFDWEGKRSMEDGLTGKYDQTIQVPFCYQSRLSGIEVKEDCPVVWYRKTVLLERKNNKRILLKFGAVDYKAWIWVNGKFAGSHEGGYSPFAIDITDIAVNGNNTIVVRAEDYPDACQPRGKQTWTGEGFACWYTPVSGIWQSVWIEYAADIYLHRVKITPDLEKLTALVEVFISSQEETLCEIHTKLPACTAPYKIGTQQLWCRNGYGRTVLSFMELDVKRNDLLWAPEHPNLINVEIIVKGKCGEDKVTAYFGMRSIEASGSHILLNGEIFFQRLILDQGYWEESLLTPPSEEAIVKDLELIKTMGFNGIRMHQKIEDPLFYYHADRMGLLVWGELPSAYMYNDQMVQSSINEMGNFLDRDFNHPSIITWVPVNESWGVRNVRTNKMQQSYVLAMYHFIKAMDETRLISANDGWEQPGCTDICAVHDYIYTNRTPGKYNNGWEDILSGGPEKRLAFAKGESYGGQPVILSEYGGIAFDNGEDGWGYLEKATSESEFLERLKGVTEDLIKCGRFAGFCYTQLTDVQQEVNGLLTPERSPKADIDKLKEIFGFYA